MQLVKKYSTVVNFIIIFVISFLVFGYMIGFNNTNTFPDPDGFYHMRVSNMIYEQGVFKGFPWMKYTIFQNGYTDHHLLFHLIWIPFLKIFGDFSGAKIAMAFFSGLVIPVFYTILKTNKIRYPVIWTMLFFVMSYAYFFRMSLVKVVGLSLVVLLFILIALFKEKPKILGVLCFLYVWLYGGFVYSIAIVSLYVGAKFLTEGKFEYKILIYSILGTFLGIILSPYFPQNIGFLFTQIFEAGIVYTAQEGNEWQPFDSWYLFTQNLSLLVFLFAITLISYIRGYKFNTKTLALFLMNIMFMILNIKSRRFAEVWPVFLLLFISFAFENFFNDIENIRQDLEQKFKNPPVYRFFNVFLKFGFALLVTIVMLVPRPMYKEMYKTINSSFPNPPNMYNFLFNILDIKTSLNPTYNTYDVKQNMDYISTHSNKGDLIYNERWSDFSVFFYYNQKNTYITGLSTTFLYSYNKDLFKKYNDIAKVNGETSVDEIKNTFKAKWVVVNKDNEKLIEELQNNIMFEERNIKPYNKYAVFKVK